MPYETRTAILDPKTGYNKVAGEYNKSRGHLDSFDKGAFLRYLPRNLADCDILDLGAGDGRMQKFFDKEQYTSYTACDIAEQLLERHPSWPNIKKIICNLEEALPFEDESFDLLLSFFVLEHIEHLEGLFEEATRVMKPWSTWIVGHFKQRRAYEYKHGHEKFKIERFTHHVEHIKKLAEYNFLDFFDKEIVENGISVGDILVLVKN